MPLTTTTLEPLTAAVGQATPVLMYGAVILCIGIVASVAVYICRNSTSVAGSVNRRVRKARLSHPLSPSAASVREDIFSPDMNSMSRDSIDEDEMESSQSSRFKFNFGEEPPMASPERAQQDPRMLYVTNDKARQLQDACFEGGRLEVFSKSTSRWLVGTVVKVKSGWLVIEYPGLDGS